MSNARAPLLFGIVLVLVVLTGQFQSWNTALTIVNMGLVSAIMALGLNLQWGFAGLFNVGVMGFVALGGLAAVLVAMPATEGALAAGGLRIYAALLFAAAVIVAAIAVNRNTTGRARFWATFAVLITGFVIYRIIFDPAKAAVEAIDPALTGYVGGLSLPILISWPVGGLLAAGAAWLIGKTALGLRSDYLAIATLGIAEIVIAILKNEDWLARGVKNVVGLPRPVPLEVDLQNDPGFVSRAEGLGIDPTTASTLYVKLSYSILFTIVLVAILILAQLALKSPWGRMMRAIRDNETAAGAMGKDVTWRHLQIFVIGSAVCGIAGAMMTTLDGQLTPGSYQPLRFTFLIWVMVIVGGSGNNLGAVLGGFLIWFLWVQVEPMSAWLVVQLNALAAALPDGAGFSLWFQNVVAGIDEARAHLRLLTMGVVLLVVLRFSPRGLLPER